MTSCLSEKWLGDVLVRSKMSPPIYILIGINTNYYIKIIVIITQLLHETVAWIPMKCEIVVVTLVRDRRQEP